MTGWIIAGAVVLLVFLLLWTDLVLAVQLDDLVGRVFGHGGQPGEHEGIAPADTHRGGSGERPRGTVGEENYSRMAPLSAEDTILA